MAFLSGAAPPRLVGSVAAHGPRRAAAAASARRCSSLRWGGGGQHTPRFNVHEHLWGDQINTQRQAVKLQHFGIDPQSVGAVGDFAVTKPFRLLSPEAVRIVNQELKRIGPSCTFSAPPFAPCVMRGVTHYSSFIDELWSSPEISSLLSAVSGVPLKPHPMKLERAHVNIQRPKPAQAAVAASVGTAADDQEPNDVVFGWHTDSQPFVCIVMLSDPPENAIGGETMVRMPEADGAGEQFGLTFPAAGFAYLMQGSVLPHCAMPALNYNRMTMITSFVYADPLLSEKSDLGLAAHYTPANQLRAEYASYRLEAAANKALALRSRLRVGEGNMFDSDFAIQQLDNIAADLAHTRNSLEAVRSTAGPEVGFGTPQDLLTH